MAEQLGIVVAGGVGAMPFAGVGWQVAQYLEGFRRLGHRVFYLEDTQRWPYDPIADTVCDDAGPALAYVQALMRRCGLQDSWAYRDAAAGGLHGSSERRLSRVLEQADVLVNLSGATLLRDEHLRVPVRVYLETDPVMPQVEIAQGREFTIEFLAAHTHHFTYGQNFGAPDCGVPIERFRYHATRPPVILDWWTTHRPAAEAPDLEGRPFTTIANWRQTGKDIEWNGRMLTWSKHLEFERFIDLPELVGVPLELALALDDEPTLARLRSAGWRVRSAAPLSKDLDSYRAYIIASAGEFSAAKEQNIVLRSGWFSDRTACYLAACRPAIVQDTAFDCALPTGEGLFSFADLDQALGAFESVASDYARHCRAAGALAREYLKAETVLGVMLDGLASSESPVTGGLLAR